MGDLESAVQRDLDRWGEEIATSALAAAALDTARRLDVENVSPSAASLLHGQLRQYLADLRELAPAGEEADDIDELEARREERRRRASGEG